jgi:hypothetical protein
MTLIFNLDVGPDPGPEIAQLLEFRLRARGDPAMRALVDHCLGLVCRARSAAPDEMAQLVEAALAIEQDLALRFGAPKGAFVQ